MQRTGLRSSCYAHDVLRNMEIYNPNFVKMFTPFCLTFLSKKVSLVSFRLTFHSIFYGTKPLDHLNNVRFITFSKKQIKGFLETDRKWMRCRGACNWWQSRFGFLYLYRTASFLSLAAHRNVLGRRAPECNFMFWRRSIPTFLNLDNHDEYNIWMPVTGWKCLLSSARCPASVRHNGFKVEPNSGYTFFMIENEGEKRKYHDCAGSHMYLFYRKKDCGALAQTLNLSRTILPLYFLYVAHDYIHHASGDQLGHGRNITCT